MHRCATVLEPASKSREDVQIRAVHAREVHEPSRDGNEQSGAFWRVRRSAIRQSWTSSVTIRREEQDITFRMRRSGGPIH
jgi:hypothetical protein